MGARRLSSTSPSRRRFRSRSPVCVTEETDSVYGITSVLIWLIASSSLICVVSPPAKFSEDEMFNSNTNFGSNHYDPYQYDEQQSKMEQVPPFFNRPMGLRWRDDANLAMNNFYTVQMMPVLTQHRSVSPFGRAPSSSRPTTSNRFDYDSPSLEDIDLIDVLWRDDIAREKGGCQVAPAEQCERDLQMLTEKSSIQPLTPEEHAKFEDLSKGFYNGFYPSIGKTETFGVKPRTEEYDIPTDEDLAELLDDVSKEEGQLNSLFENTSQPLRQNVSMSEAIVYSQNNLTEMSEMREEREQIIASSSSSSCVELPSSIYHSSSDVNSTQQWMRSAADLGPADVFPSMNYGFMPAQNETEVVVSNGNVEYDHAYHGSSKKPESLTPVFDLYHSTRQSFSDCNTDSSSTCSRLSSESPRYNSESSSSSSAAAEYPVSRFFGKLVPNDRSYSTSSPRPSSPRSSKIGRVVPIGMMGVGGGDKRKRGRQSKDEQLASDNRLPVSARQISEMTLAELQLVLKSERLNEAQRELIRKIRRRGKNKVAARTCRQRRTDRHEKALTMPQ